MNRRIKLLTSAATAGLLVVAGIGCAQHRQPEQVAIDTTAAPAPEPTVVAEVPMSPAAPAEPQAMATDTVTAQAPSSPSTDTMTSSSSTAAPDTAVITESADTLAPRADRN